MIIASAVFIPGLEKDTRSDAFMPADHPALVCRDKVKEIFGLKAPMVIVVVNDGTTGVFNPHTLELVHWLTQRVESVHNIDPERVTSLATENDIRNGLPSLSWQPGFTRRQCDIDCSRTD